MTQLDQKAVLDTHQHISDYGNEQRDWESTKQGTITNSATIDSGCIPLKSTFWLSKLKLADEDKRSRSVEVTFRRVNQFKDMFAVLSLKRIWKRQTKTVKK